MAQSFTCENLHSYLFWLHTHCTCIKLYKLPLDQKTGLQKNRYKTPMKSPPPPFFPSQTSSVSKERVNQVLVREIFDVESEFQCTDLSTRAVVYNPSKFTTSHSKKNISWNIKSQPKFVNDLRIRMSDRWNAWMCIIM